MGGPFRSESVACRKEDGPVFPLLAETPLLVHFEVIARDGFVLLERVLIRPRDLFPGPGPFEERFYHVQQGSFNDFDPRAGDGPLAYLTRRLRYVDTSTVGVF